MIDCIRARIALAILCFFGFINLYLIRFSFSITAVAMITPFEEQQAQQRQEKLCQETGICSQISDENNTSSNIITMDWSERQRALIVGMFSYGYTLTQIIGGRLAELYGTKFIYGFAVVTPAIFTFLIPVAAKMSFWAVVVIRFLQGLIQGVAWPTIYVLLANWYPPNERSRFIGISALGATFGMVFIMPFSGFLSDYFNWEISCYIIGAIPIIWGIFWIALMHPKPKYHPRISEREKSYIETSIREGGTREIKARKIPWKSIFTSLPFIASVACDFGNSFGLTIYSSQLPNYLANVYHLNFAKTGIITGLPFLCRYIGSCLFSSIADYLITKKIFSITTVRRIFSTICMFGPAFLMTFIALKLVVTVKIFIVVTCLALFLNGAISASQLVNAVDIAPNYAGTLFGISNTFSSISSFLCMLITGEILNTKEPGVDQWSYVFWLSVPVMVSTEIFYLIFMSAEPQPWNFYEEEIGGDDVEEERDQENVEMKQKESEVGSG